MFITPSFKKSLIVEQFQGNYLIITIDLQKISSILRLCLLDVLPLPILERTLRSQGERKIPPEE